MHFITIIIILMQILKNILLIKKSTYIYIYVVFFILNFRIWRWWLWFKTNMKLNIYYITFLFLNNNNNNNLYILKKKIKKKVLRNFFKKKIIFHDNNFLIILIYTVYICCCWSFLHAKNWTNSIKTTNYASIYIYIYSIKFVAGFLVVLNCFSYY